MKTGSLFFEMTGASTKSKTASQLPEIGFLLKISLINIIIESQLSGLCGLTVNQKAGQKE